MDFEILLLKTIQSGTLTSVLLVWAVWRIHVVENIVKSLVAKCPMCGEREKGSIIATLGQSVPNIPKGKVANIPTG